MSEADEKRRGGPQLLLLMVVFGLPMIMAWLFYFNPDLLPGGRSNKGELIQPVRAVPDQLFTTLEGKSFSRKALMGYWTLLYSAGDQCGEPCQKRIYDMRQIRKAMAEHHGSIKRVALFSTTTLEASFSSFIEAFSGTTILLGSAETLAPLRQQLIPAGAASVGHLYLIDPLGNLMMYYRPEQPSEEVLSDMELLLKVNKWGGGH